MKNPRAIIFHTIALLIVGLSFFIARYVNVKLPPFLALNDLTQFIYLPSGIRLIAVVVFGWVGAAGIMLGWIFCHLFGDEKSFLECLFIGLISGATAMASLQIWQGLLRIEGTLNNLTLKRLILLVLLSSLLTALTRYVYIASIDVAAQFWPIFAVGLIGDIAGTMIILYLLKVFMVAWKFFSMRLL